MGTQNLKIKSYTDEEKDFELDVAYKSHEPVWLSVLWRLRVGPTGLRPPMGS